MYPFGCQSVNRSPGNSSAQRIAAIPAMRLDALGMSEPSARIQPKLCPGLGIGQGQFRVAAALCDEPREMRPARSLPDGVIAQIETPAEGVAPVIQRGVLAHRMEEQDAAGIERDGHCAFLFDERFGNADLIFGCAMEGDALAVALGQHLQAAIFRRCLGYGYPAGDHLCFVRFR